MQSKVEITVPAVSSPAPALPSPVMPALGMTVNVSVGDRNGGESDSEKKKRGRPRKYGPDGTMALSRCFTSTDGFGGRKGRPPGTGKRQMLAACGELLADQLLAARGHTKPPKKNFLFFFGIFFAPSSYLLLGYLVYIFVTTLQSLFSCL